MSGREEFEKKNVLAYSRNRGNYIMFRKNMGTSMHTLSYYVIIMLTCGERVRNRLVDGVLILLELRVNYQHDQVW